MRQNQKELLITQFIEKAELCALLALTYGIKSAILGYTNKASDYFDEYLQIHPDFLIQISS
jgi:hypothetical protein